MRRFGVFFLIAGGLVLALVFIGWQVLHRWGEAEAGRWAFAAAGGLAAGVVLLALLAGRLRRGRPGIPVTRAAGGAQTVETAPVELAPAGWDAAGGLDPLLAGCRKPPLMMTSPPPAGTAARWLEYEEVIEALLDPSGIGVVGISTSLPGAGGFGKTTLARAVCYDRRVWEAFPDGILWASPGESAPHTGFAASAADLAAIIEGWGAEAAPVWEAKARLREALKGRRALLVIDGVARRSDVDLFWQPGSKTVCLVITRHDEALPRSAPRVRVDAMRPSEAAAVLAEALRGAGVPEADLLDMHEELLALAGRLGEWPLLLRLAGGMLAGLVERGYAGGQALAGVNRAYNRLGLAPFDARDPAGRRRAAEAVLEAGLEGLDRVQKERFRALAVFAGEGQIPLSALAALWGCEGEAGAAALAGLCSLLQRRGLLEAYDHAAGAIRIHDVVQEWLAERQAARLPELHGVLLAGYRRRCPGGAWSAGPPDGYFFRRLAEHLAKAGWTRDLASLLLDPTWMAARLRNGGIRQLLEDYETGLRQGLADREAIRLVHGALCLARGALARDPDQLAPQLAGRLAAFDMAEIQKLLEEVRRAARPPWLRPARGCLLAPGGARSVTLAGHTGAVLAFAVCPDGKRVISGGEDKTLKVWDLESGRLIHSLTGHTMAVTAAAVSPDGRRAVSGSADHTLKVWDLESGRLLYSRKVHNGLVTAVQITPDGRRGLSVSNEYTLSKAVRVWDLESGEPLGEIRAHVKPVTALALTPDGGRLLTGSEDQTVKVWDLAGGQLIHSLEGCCGAVQTLAVHPDGLRALSGSADGGLCVWDLAEGRLIHALEGHAGAVTAAAFCLEGRRALSASEDRTLKVWDVASGKLLNTLAGHAAPVRCAAVTPDGRRAVSASDEGALRLWDLAGGRLLYALEGHSQPVTSAAFTPDGRKAVSGSADWTLKVWDLSSGTLIPQAEGHAGAVTSITFTPEGRRAVTGSADSTLKVWDAESGALLRTLKGHTGGVVSLAVSANGRRVVSAAQDRTINLWALESGRLARPLSSHPAWLKAAAVWIAQGGDRAVSVLRDGTARVWEVETGRPVCRLGEGWEAASAAVSADGRWAVTNSGKAGLRLWELDSGRLVRSLGGPAAAGAAAIAPDGSLAAAADGSSLEVWDLKTGKRICSLAGSTGEVRCAAFSPEGRVAVSGSAGGGLAVWDLDAGQRLAGLDLNDALTACAVSPDGQYLAAGGQSGAVYLLRLEGQELQPAQTSIR